MAKQFTTTGTPAEAVKLGRGTPLRSFGTKAQGMRIHRNETLGVLVLIGILGRGIYSAIKSINYLGFDYYLQNRKSGLIWTVIFAIGLIFRIIHLKKVRTTRAELFTKGFYLKHGSKEYAYAFSDIAHLQKSLLYGGNHQINSVNLTLHLTAGEKIEINESGTQVIIPFADALSSAYAQSKEQAVLEQFKKGERIGFGLIELDKNGVFFDEKESLRNEVSEIKKARSERYLLVHDRQGKKIAKWDVNKIWDEDLFFVILELVGKKVVT